MRLRQVALVARELDPVVAQLCEVLGVEVCFNDPGVAEFGLKNALMPIGEDAFLEVVVPNAPNTAAERYLERRNGDGGYMAIFQTHDLAAERKRMNDLGVRIVWEVDHNDAATIHLHPRDVGGAIVSLDVMKPADSWRWAGPKWRDHRRTQTVTALAGVEVQAENPQAVGQRWAEVLRSDAQSANGAWRIPLDQDTYARVVPLRDDRGEGISGIDVRVRNGARLGGADQARVGGILFRAIE
ncbi:MAG: VOC family protein [Candidatus Hydrogenedentales bacterium]